MKAKIIIIKEFLFWSFWLTPLLLIFWGIFLAIVSIFIDSIISIPKDSWLTNIFSWWIEGYRDILWTISGSMMTITSVVFSMTLVALSLTAGQYGSRIIRSFMNDKLNQFVLWSYLATFTYCLIILRVVRTEEYISFRPDISIVIAMILALLNIILLIIYIHHVSKSIQVENIIADIYNELSNTIEKLYKDKKIPLAWEQENIKLKNIQSTLLQYPKKFEIVSNTSWYIEYIDYKKIFQTAEKNWCIIHLQHKSGDYLLQWWVVAKIYVKKLDMWEIQSQVLKSFEIGKERTTSQDIRFSFQQLTEIAVRALSPGINDPYTAISCLNVLSSSIAIIDKKQLLSWYKCSELWEITVLFPTVEFEELIDLIFSQITHYAVESPLVIRHIDTLYDILSHIVTDPEHKMVIVKYQKELKTLL